MFQKMWDIKKFLLLWRTTFTPEKISQFINDPDDPIDLTRHEQDEMISDIQEEMYRTVSLSIAFYHSVLQQKNVEKPWRDEYSENGDGSLVRIGVSYDKIFAIRFLLGDEGFAYDPSRAINYVSYHTYADTHRDIRYAINRATEATITKRVDMDDWFQSYGWALFAENANNPYNLSLIHI